MNKEWVLCSTSSLPGSQVDGLLGDISHDIEIKIGATNKFQNIPRHWDERDLCSFMRDEGHEVYGIMMPWDGSLAQNNGWALVMFDDGDHANAVEEEHNHWAPMVM